jgi:hypothetical protein
MRHELIEIEEYTPRTEGESEKAGVPSQWEGTGQEEKEKAGWPGVPRNGKERARKKWRKRDGRGSLAMGRNGPGRKRRKRDGRGSLAMGRNRPVGEESGISARLEAESESDVGSGAGLEAEEMCRIGEVLLLPRSRHGGTARGRRLAAGAVGELGSARSPGIVGRKKHGFRGGFCGRG